MRRYGGTRMCDIYDHFPVRLEGENIENDVIFRSDVVVELITYIK